MNTCQYVVGIILKLLVLKGIQVKVVGKAKVNFTDDDNNTYRASETYLRVETPLRAPGNNR